MVQTAQYDKVGPNVRSKGVIEQSIRTVADSLQAILTTAPRIKVTMPPEILTYVDQGRNPDIYTREFVELARRNNQELKGKMSAFADFADILEAECKTVNLFDGLEGVEGNDLSKLGEDVKMGGTDEDKKA